MRGLHETRPVDCPNLAGCFRRTPRIGEARSADAEGAWDALHMAAGFNYAPHGIQQSPQRERANFPHGLLWDWMHNLCASGGIAQLECGQFLRRLVRSGTATWSTLDDFKDFARFPKVQGTRLRLSLKERVPLTSNTKPMRVFASACSTRRWCCSNLGLMGVRPRCSARRP